jgi:MSHA biogenesis protein MshI
MRWPSKRQNSNERMVISWSGQTLSYICAQLRADGTHKVLKFGVERQGADSTQEFVHRLQALGLDGLNANIMLRPEQYQFLQIDAPAVPDEELRSAIRYQVQGMLNTDVGDVTLDVMRLGDGQQQNEAGQLFVVAAGNAVMREALALSDAMDWNVDVIDVQETAQRDLQSALVERDGQAGAGNAAMVLSDGSPAVLTISVNNELFYTQRFELPEGFLVASRERESDAPSESANSVTFFAPVDDLIPSFLAEVQSALDIWSRSWASIPLDGMSIYAGERTEELSTWFGEQLGQTVLPMDVSDAFPEFKDGIDSGTAQCLPLLGALVRAPITNIPQKINLFTQIQVKEVDYFLAQTMLQYLAVLVLLGGCLIAYWTWSINVTGEDIKRSMATQAMQLTNLRAVIVQRKAASQPNPALVEELENSRAELLQLEELAQDLERGLVRPGGGHAARLRLVAQSIPAQVWVTEMKTDETQFEVSGFTIEPAVLSEWVAMLTASPLLEGQKLSAVNLENASTTMLKTMGGTSRPVWSFRLLSAMPLPTVLPEVKS